MFVEMAQTACGGITMRFCKDCIHYAVCERHAGDIPDSVIEGYKYDVIESLCHDFRENGETQKTRAKEQ